MNAPLHTPGPWTMDRQNPYVMYVRGRANENGSYAQQLEALLPQVPERPSCYVVVVVHPGYDDAQDANAILIAAAPKLLRALEQLVAKSTDIDGDWSAEWRDALDAISDATGAA